MGCAMKLLKREEAQKTPTDKRFLLLGLDNAGKTSIMLRLQKKVPVDLTPTVGLNVEQVQHRNANITVWDLGGAATMLWKHYYANTDAVIFVVDLADTTRLSQAQQELQQVVEDPTLLEAPLLVYGNKQDLCPTATVENLGSSLNFGSFNKKHKLIQLCSATGDTGIWEGFDKLLDIVLHITPPS